MTLTFDLKGIRSIWPVLLESFFLGFYGMAMVESDQDTMQQTLVPKLIETCHTSQVSIKVVFTTIIQLPCAFTVYVLFSPLVSSHYARSNILSQSQDIWYYSVHWLSYIWVCSLKFKKRNVHLQGTQLTLKMKGQNPLDSEVQMYTFNRSVLLKLIVQTNF